MTCFANAVKQNIRLFPLLYGNEHACGRERAMGKLIWLHDQRPELFSVEFLVISWSRICYEYTDSIRAGVRTTARLLHE